MPPPRFSGVATVALAFWAACGDSVDLPRRDPVHSVEKTHVTIIHNVVRRDHPVTVCPTNHNLCPDSMNGGCCPTRYNCGTDSCYATTTATSTCKGRAGYYGCPMELGGACCPVGYRCRRDDCVPPEGVSHALECPTNYFQCPSSLNYGCCRDGLGCAPRACYSTEPSTYVITRVSTSTDADDDETTITELVTTVSTPSAPTGYETVGSGDDQPQVVVKFYPDSVAKVAPEVTVNGGGSDGGLTTGHIVGIVIGVVGLLLIVIVAAWIIIRHLNKVVQVVESKQGTSKDSQGTKDRPTMVHYRMSGSKPTPSEIDDMSVDPLMMTSPRPSHRRFDSDSDGVGIGIPSPTLGTPSPHAPGGYQAVPNSASERHRSYDSAYPGDVGYFDTLPDRSQRASGQSSLWAANRQSSESQGTQNPGQAQHGRHWSNASELSTTEATAPAWNNNSNNNTNPQELDSTAFTPELHGESLISPIDPMSPGLNDPRRASGGSNISAMTTAGGVGAAKPTSNQPRRRSSEGRSRPEGVPSAAVGQGTLSVVAEDTEVIGHYGPSDRTAGQTAVGLNQWDWRQPDQHQGLQ